ncbi:prepilin-type N-terminal cleavage/methylation domain-containing protein [Acidimicrobiaceae bacterium USS-CC1]|uniref:Prepilin-type N-terminal cleavage/methylation domain-containing protein n=1 Tax=Acidiferrimicrobium australe TaxID=2664430 RepID=A0ABW9QN65_9ACTN|nr:prepilin-type N-terminal cleavage/methylation domain-containing protein [Acidiferrimicrobium australe]
MLNTLKKRLGRKEDEGFTLIELMVVVLIIAILMAIAIPTFLSARGNAQAKAAESNLRNATTDEQTYLTGPGQGSTYGTSADLTSNSVDNSLTFVSTIPSSTTPSPSTIGIAISGSATDPQVALVDQGADGKWYEVFDNNGSVTYAVSATAPTAFPTAALGSTTWSGAGG